MRSQTLTSSASAVLLLTASLVSAKHGVHEHLEALHRRHNAARELARSLESSAEAGIEERAPTADALTSDTPLEKRGGQCQFPTNAGLVAVTPGSENAGWAMSPNQPCTPGSYCPYACPPGQVMMQWDPSATSYSYPKSMNGGLYCDNNGNIIKPFPGKPYCAATTANIGAQNDAGSVVSFCQTVLPGNEAMLIPTAVNGYATLANPGMDYWCNTAAHYYINPPGIGTDEACVWGTNANPYGNWSPYVAGANTDSSGETFIKLGWNPIYLEAATPFRNTMPTWGVKIDCPNGGCNGLPCAIDPSQNSVNQMVGSNTVGAGGATFCVVTVAKGSTANFIVFEGSAANAGSASAGRFYESSSAAWSSSAAATTSSSQSSSSSEWASSTTTTAMTTGWSMSNTTSHSSRQPTHSPYMSLFNHSMPATATNSPTGPPSVSSIPATGGAASTTISVTALITSLIMGVYSYCL